MWFKCKTCKLIFNETNLIKTYISNIYSEQPMVFCPDCGTDETMLIAGELCSICKRFIANNEEHTEINNTIYCRDCKKELED